MRFPKYYIGPMSKNVVDCIINHKHAIGFIPSRRQIDFSSGYVNDWNTESFTKYVKDRNSSVLICRDHGGEKQGQVEDDGMESFYNDAEYFDLIHIDPFRVATNISTAAAITGNMIKQIWSKNQNMMYLSLIHI